MQNDVNVRMNWFERHLNWTAAGMGVGSLVLYAVLIIVGLGLDIIYLNRYLELSFISLFLDVFPVICFTLLSVTGYHWVLRRKNRNPLFLLFFLPVIFTCVLVPISKIVIPNNEYFFIGTIAPVLSIFFPYRFFKLYPFLSVAPPSPLPTQIFWINIFIFITAWIVLIFLKNRRIPETAEHMDTKNTFQKFLFTKTRILLLVLVTLIFTAASFFNISFGYSYFQSNQPGSNIPPQIPVFSLEYPKHFSQPSVFPSMSYLKIDDQIIKLDDITLGEIWRWKDYSFVNINVLSQDATQQLIDVCGMTEDGFIDMLGKYLTLSDEKHQAIISTVMVGDISARQQFLAYKQDPSDIHWEDDRTVMMIDFLHDNRLWFIYSGMGDEVLKEATPAFSHLLETFKIYDE
jgi:hypothetical protein